MIDNSITLFSSNSRKGLPSHILDKLESVNAFYSCEYERLMRSSGFEVVYIYSENMIIIAILRKMIIFHSGNFPSEPIELHACSIEYMQKFLDSCLNYMQSKYNLDWMSPNLAASMFKVAPSKCIKIPFGNHVVKLSSDEETLWAAIHGKHRNSIRRAEKAGVKIVDGGIEYLDDYMALEKETWARSGKSGSSKAMLENYVTQLGDKARIFVSYKSEEAQSGAIFMYNRDCCYYIYGSSKNRPEPGSANLLHWEAMKYMKNFGVNRYSFVGARINEDANSKYHGLQRFKKRFGGDLIQGFMFKSIFKPWKYELYYRLLFLKNNKGKRYQLDAIDQEKHKWAELNEI